GGRAIQGVNFAIPVELAQAFAEAGGTTVRPPAASAAPASNGQAYWTVCVWCDFGSQDPKTEADRVASELRAAGLPAAILWSGDYPSMAPGYWVTYSGVFELETQAETYQATVARAGFGGHVRLVSNQPTPATAVPSDQPFWTAIAGSFG